MNPEKSEKMRQDGWSEESIDCAERFGYGPTMLVPYVYRKVDGVVVEDGRVMTPKGGAVLLAAFEWCHVLTDREKARAKRAKANQKGKPTPGVGAFAKMQEVHWSDVVPEHTEDARRMRNEGRA